MGKPDLHLAVALDGAGWHPASWREPDGRPRDLLTAGYWADLVVEAERGLLDLVTIEDALGAPPPGVHGRLDAVLVAARVAPLTRHIGIVPTQVVTHTEPFHASKAIATLDYVSTGRAGVRVRISHHPGRGGAVRRGPSAERLLDDADAAALGDLFDEAADYVEVLRRLWDSWEDDAEIRDVATGRFVDRDKLHYIDFEGAHFSVRGPSITPRPPQGQPLVAALAHRDVAYRLIGRSADLGFVTPRDAADATALVDDDPRRAGRRRARRGDRARARRRRGFPRRVRRRGGRAQGAARRAARARVHAATRTCSSAPRPSSPTWRWSGTPPGSPACGCGPARCPSTWRRSPAAWCRSCSGAAPSAPRTRPTPCAGCSVCPAPRTATPPA